VSVLSNKYGKQLLESNSPTVVDRASIFFLFVIFTLFYFFYGGKYFIGDSGLCYSAFASLCTRLEYVNIFDYIKGYKEWGPIDYDTLVYAQELVKTFRYDALIAHPIFLPLEILGYNLLHVFVPHIQYMVSSQVTMSLVSALGVVWFYQIMKISGKSTLISIIGASILGLSFIYRNNAEGDTGILSYIALIMVLRVHFKYISGGRTILNTIWYGVCFSFSLLLYNSPLVLLPGLFVSYLMVEKDFKKVVQFVVVSFFVVLFCTNYFYTIIFKYIDSVFYSGNIYGFQCKDFWENMAYVFHFMGAHGGLKGGIILVGYNLFYNVTQLLILAPKVLSFPIGVLIIYCMASITMVKIKKDNDKYFTTIITILFFLLLYIFGAGVYHVKQVSVIFPFVVYVISEGISVKSKGLFAGFFNIRMTNILIAVYSFVLIGGIVFDSFYPFKGANAYYNWNPPQDKMLLSQDFYDTLNAKLKRNSIILYDYSYVGDTLGNDISIKTDLLSPCNGNFCHLWMAGNFSPFFLEYFMEINNPREFYMLSSQGDTEFILVPKDKYLSEYLLFERQFDYEKKWYIYKYDGKVINKQNVFIIFNREHGSLPTNSLYSMQDLYWKRGVYKNKKTLALVPVEDDVIGNNRYRKSKSLVYW